jgi:nicotinamide riboside kinase
MIPRRILVTGPESTGKSVLSRSLAEHFNGSYIPELARDYISGLKRDYTLQDVLHIAKQQEEQYAATTSAEGWFFFDTWLIITRVWLEVVFGECPGWIDDAIQHARFDAVLLCYYDIPWEPDPLRENGGVMRERLYERYRHILQKNEIDFFIIRGTGDVRRRNAIRYLANRLG